MAPSAGRGRRTLLLAAIPLLLTAIPLLLTACSVLYDPPPPSGTPAPTRGTPELTPVPGGSTAPSAGASSAAVSPPTQTDTEWGRIWDGLPAGFPLPPGAVPTEIGEGAASATLAIGSSAESAATYMQSAMTAAGFSFESMEGPSEDGGFTLNAVGGDPACMVQVRLRPLSGTTAMIVMYGASCPLD